MPKLSRYNHLQPWANGYHIAFNANSGAVALMTEENVAVYTSLAGKLQSGSNVQLTDKEAELLKQLQYGFFAIDDSIDELRMIRFRHNMDRYDRAMLGLTLAPTMACNMACKYCFEENKTGRMSPQVVEKLVEFVERQAPRLAALNVSWYGGEPLLAMDIIEDLSETFIDMSKEHKFSYSGSMISNGFLLTPATVDRLCELSVMTVQVTIDGPERIHNVKRPMKNGKPSFETILGNLAYAAEKMGVGIRVNIDKSFTADMIRELLSEFKRAGIHEKVGVYFGLLEAATKVCANINEACYETADFSQIETDYYRLLLDDGFRIDRLPSPLGTYCMAQLVNSFLIDPSGDIYRCFNHIGDASMTAGNIARQVDYNHPNFVRLFDFQPLDDARCRECNLLPVCMGGCPSRRADRSLSGDKLCESWKHNLQPMLEIIAKSKQQEMQRRQREQAAAPAAKE